MGDTTHWPVHVHPALWPVIWPSSNQGSKNIKHIKHYLTLFNIFQKFPKHPVTLWYSLCSLSCPVLLNGIQEADGMAHIAARSLGEAMLCWESAIYQNLPTSWQSGLLTFWISRFGVFFQEWNQDVGWTQIYQNLSESISWPAIFTHWSRQARSARWQATPPALTGAAMDGAGLEAGAGGIGAPACKGWQISRWNEMNIVNVAGFYMFQANFSMNAARELWGCQYPSNPEKTSQQNR